MQEPTFDSKHLAKKVFLKFVKSQIFRLQKIFQEELYPSKNTSEKEKNSYGFSSTKASFIGQVL